MAQSNNYWRGREEENLRANRKTEAEYEKAINDTYKYMLDQIQKEINGFYAKYLAASTYSIPENYWAYILLSLINEEYVKGIVVNHTKDGVLFGDLQEAIITPKGIEYLFENSLIEKAKKTLKDVKDMIPFI